MYLRVVWVLYSGKGNRRSRVAACGSLLHFAYCLLIGYYLGVAVLPMTHKERFDKIGIRPPKGEVPLSELKSLGLLAYDVLRYLCRKCLCS